MSSKYIILFRPFVLGLFIAGSVHAAPHIEILPKFSGAHLDSAISLQGLQNRNDNEKIWINRNSTPFWPDIFESKYGYDVTWFNATDSDDGLMNVLNQYAGVFDGYILYDESGNEVSKFVALSLAGILDAVAIDDSLEASFISNVGKPKLADVRTRDAAWLWANYGTQFSKTGMGLPNTLTRTMSADYAIMQRWAFVPSTDQTACESFLNNLNANATLTGWLPMYLVGAEDAMVTYFSNFDVKLLAGVNTMYNFSAVSKISDYSSGNKEPITFSQDMDKPSYVFDPSKHYVTLYCNSGGNFNYVNRRYLTDTGNAVDSDNWMNVPHTVPLTLAMAPMATELSAAALNEIYDRKSSQDSFATPYSGHAYIHPSRYTSLPAFASETHTYMALADQTCLASQETGNIIDQNWVDNYGATLLAPDQVSGIFCQQGPFGKIYEGSNKKPVITRRTGMNIHDSASIMADFINEVNSWQPSPHTEAGYSVIQVNFESTNIQDCQELYESVAPHIKFVTLEELFYHIRHQVFEGSEEITTTVPVMPLDDTYCTQENPIQNYGNAAELTVRAASSLDRQAVSFLKFNVDLDDKNEIADCWLWVKSASSMDDASIYQVQNTAWNEDTLTWINQPEIGESLATVNNIGSEKWYAFNVGSQVTSNGTYSFALQSSDESASLNWYSSETTNSPYLLITTNVASSPENVAATAGDRLVALAWTAQPEVAGYVIKRKQGWNGSFSDIATVTANTYTDTGLINGEGYYYTVSAFYDNSPNPNLQSTPSAQVGASPAISTNSPVLTDFLVVGAAASSVDLTWSNLTGIVTMNSSEGLTPEIDDTKNALSETGGVSGVISVNVLAVDDGGVGSSEEGLYSFDPTTWSGGGQSEGNSIDGSAAAGWGVRRDDRINGNIQSGEALILTFDLSGLTMEADQFVTLKGIRFYDQGDGTANGDVWMRNFEVNTGTAGAGVQLADNVFVYSTPLVISDGDQLALMRGARDTRLTALELDIVNSAGSFGYWIESFGLYGTSDADPYSDVDGDGLANLYEYGVNGNPADAANKGVVPKITGLINDVGSNYLEYVYVRRYNPPEIVSVHPETTTDLLSGVWTNAHYNVISTTPLDHEFEVVTNRVETTAPVRMIRLRVDGP